MGFVGATTGAGQGGDPAGDRDLPLGGTTDVCPAARWSEVNLGSYREATRGPYPRDICPLPYGL